MLFRGPTHRPGRAARNGGPAGIDAAAAVDSAPVTSSTFPVELPHPAGAGKRERRQPRLAEVKRRAANTSDDSRESAVCRSPSKSLEIVVRRIGGSDGHRLDREARRQVEPDGRRNAGRRPARELVSNSASGDDPSRDCGSAASDPPASNPPVQPHACRARIDRAAAAGVSTAGGEGLTTRRHLTWMSPSPRSTAPRRAALQPDGHRWPA